MEYAAPVVVFFANYPPSGDASALGDSHGQVKNRHIIAVIISQSATAASIWMS